jgi:CRISPR-associated protein Cmr5
MKNLDQIRAAAAIVDAADLDKKAVNKLPAMILTNGLLATAAFCLSESEGKSRGGMKSALEATVKYLEQQRFISKGSQSLEALISDLSKGSSLELQHATSEALAFIGYLRRFATKDDNSGEE